MTCFLLVCFCPFSSNDQHHWGWKWDGWERTGPSSRAPLRLQGVYELRSLCFHSKRLNSRKQQITNDVFIPFLGGNSHFSLLNRDKSITFLFLLTLKNRAFCSLQKAVMATGRTWIEPKWGSRFLAFITTWLSLLLSECSLIKSLKC